MSKLRVFTAIVVVSLVMPLASAGQKGKPPKPPAFTPCTFGLEVTSGGSIVQVGRDVGTYGPTDQALYIHESLLPPSEIPELPGVVANLKAVGSTGGVYGPYYGQIRVLDDRIDYFFDTTKSGCLQDNKAPNLCPFRLTVVDGVPVYTKMGKTRVLTSIAFNDGRYLLDYRPCDPAVDPVNCYFKLLGCYDDRDCPGVPPGGEGYVYATVDVRFQ
jgi:hypothetical protein